MEKSYCSKPHHGQNIFAARRWKNIDQYALAEKVNVSQPKISEWEHTEKLDDEILDRIAKALDVDFDFLKNFVPESVTKSYNIQSNEFTVNSAEKSEGKIMQTAGEQINDNREETNVINPLDKVTELYEELRKQDKEIMRLRMKYEPDSIDSEE